MPFRKKIKEKAKALLEVTRETLRGQGSRSSINVSIKSDDDLEITSKEGTEVRSL